MYSSMKSRQETSSMSSQVFFTVQKGMDGRKGRGGKTLTKRIFNSFLKRSQMDFYIRTIKQQSRVAEFLVVGHPAMLTHPECKESQHTHSAGNKLLFPPASYAKQTSTGTAPEGTGRLSRPLSPSSFIYPKALHTISVLGHRRGRDHSRGLQIGYSSHSLTYDA